LAKDLRICKNKFFQISFINTCICCPSFLIISLQYVFKYFVLGLGSNDT
jgi:hypothetical protein